MKAKVTRLNFWIDGVKYTRGEIVEVDDIHNYGTALEVYVEPPKPKKKRASKKVEVKKDAED